jgi:hypothetical protein
MSSKQDLKIDRKDVSDIPRPLESGVTPPPPTQPQQDHSLVDKVKD